MGAATEFKNPEQMQRQYGAITSYQSGSVFGFAPGEGTDDSQMTIVTLPGYAKGRPPGRPAGPARLALQPPGGCRWPHALRADLRGIRRRVSHLADQRLAVGRQWGSDANCHRVDRRSSR